MAIATVCLCQLHQHHQMRKRRTLCRRMLHMTRRWTFLVPLSPSLRCGALCLLFPGQPLVMLHHLCGDFVCDSIDVLHTWPGLPCYPPPFCCGTRCPSWPDLLQVTGVLHCSYHNKKPRVLCLYSTTLLCACDTDWSPPLPTHGLKYLTDRLMSTFLCL